MGETLIETSAEKLKVEVKHRVEIIPNKKINRSSCLIFYSPQGAVNV